MNNTDFADELKTKRMESGLSQSQLASLTHLSRYSINRFENGKANASEGTRNLILRCLNYYNCEQPFYLLIDYLSFCFPTADAKEVISKVLGIKPEYFFHNDYGFYGYKEHYAYGEIKVMASGSEDMGVFLEMKGTGCRNLEYVLQAQERSWYDFLNRCVDCGGIVRRLDLAVNDMSGLLDIPVLSEKYYKGEVECRSSRFEAVNGGKLNGKGKDRGRTLYIGTKGTPLYFCLYEKDKEQEAKHQHTDIKNRFEIRLKDKRAIRTLEDLLLTHDTVGLVFSIINRFVYFPDCPLWEIFISHNELPLKMNPVPVNMDKTLKWLEKQVAPSLRMIKEIDKATGTNRMEEMKKQAILTKKHEMLIKQMCTGIQEIIEEKGVFYE